jgi:hypothetical protein
MTMLSNLPRHPGILPLIRAEAGVLLLKLRRLVNRRVARAIARRERQAELAAERYLGSIEPGEYGIFRYQVCEHRADSYDGGPNNPPPVGLPIDLPKAPSSGGASVASLEGKP